MKSEVEEALKKLEEADIAGYFNEMNKVEIPNLQLKNTYAEFKGIFISGKAPWNFTQQLEVFTQQISEVGIKFKQTFTPVPSVINPIQIEQPTTEKPMLIGFLVDVSASMASSLNNSNGQAKNRLKSFQDSFDELLKEAKSLCSSEKDNSQLLPLFKVFVYGFGFGNPLSSLLYKNRPKVRNLLSASEESITVKDLIENLDKYKSYTESITKEMFGKTPLLEALQTVKKSIEKEKQAYQIASPVILFILSDGEPTDSSNEDVIKFARESFKDDIVIISCYLTDEDITRYKTLYTECPSSWSEGAKLMWQLASSIPENKLFYEYLSELKWKYEKGAKLFTQINESNNLTEFLKIILSPLKQNEQK